MLTWNRFRQKFKSFVDQYDLRELHFQSLSRLKEVEIYYWQQEADKQKKLAQDQTEKARKLEVQVSTFTQTEAELRSQLNIYVEKFKQVRYSSIQTVLSNLVFLAIVPR
jgi:Myosin-like coiled-coil protein